jgi:hypothetical protein
MMVPETRQRFEAALGELKAYLVSTGKKGGVHWGCYVAAAAAGLHTKCKFWYAMNTPWQLHAMPWVGRCHNNALTIKVHVSWPQPW